MEKHIILGKGDLVLFSLFFMQKFLESGSNDYGTGREGSIHLSLFNGDLLEKQVATGSRSTAQLRHGEGGVPPPFFMRNLIRNMLKQVQGPNRSSITTEET